MAICCCPAMPIVRGGGLRGCGWLYQWCGSTPKPAREGRIEGIWGGQLTWSVSRASGEGVKKFKLQPRARSPKKLQFRKTIISLLVTTYSSYSSCITFYAPDIIPRKSMEGHGPSPSPSLRAGALSSFSTLHLYPFRYSLRLFFLRLFFGN